MNNKNKRNLFISLLSTIVVLLLAGFTYAYLPDIFNNLLSNEDAQNLSMETGKLSIEYTDCASDDPDACANITASLKPGDSVIKNFEVKNTGTVTLVYSILFKEIVNTFVDDELVFKIENLSNGKTIVSNKPMPYFDTVTTNYIIDESEVIRAGNVNRYRLTITFVDNDINSEENKNATFNLKIGIGTSKVSQSENILAILGLTPSEKTPNYSNVVSASEAGIYPIEDDSGISYVFRGTKSTNNYVKFANKLWRIIRINGNGTVRMITNGKVINGIQYNSIGLGNTYVGYLYGNPSSTSYNETHSNKNSSTIKVAVEKWYEDNLKGTFYESYISNEVFCNDRSLYSGLGVSAENTKYGAYGRLVDNKNPSLKCINTNDRLSVGRGLKYPIGLVTADELAISGAVYGENISDSYLNFGELYWTMTPGTSSDGNYTSVFRMSSNGYISRNSVSGTVGDVAPVINLTTEAIGKMVGSGTLEDPYRLASDDSHETLIALGLQKYLNENDPSLNSIADKDEGIFAAEDDFGISYVFRGASKNNYVQFAGFNWRIIRINGDGTLRLIFDGSEKYPNGMGTKSRTLAENIVYNENDNGLYLNSSIKEYVDNWYLTNLADTGFSSYISDSGFCGDENISSITNIINNKPNLTCDSGFYTVDNGKLMYPVGLINVNEAAYAGSLYGSSHSNKFFYLYKGGLYWTMTPSSSEKVFRVSSFGYLSDNFTSEDGYAVPVINIKSDVARSFIGSGTASNPYRLTNNNNESDVTLAALGLDKILNNSEPDFNNLAVVDEGIFEAQDDYGISYYFRGANRKNYVYFANKWWRIVRINGDGSLRIIYDGSGNSRYENGIASTNRLLSNLTILDDVLSTYSTSTARNILESWYTTNIENTGFSSYVADTSFCQDTNNNLPAKMRLIDYKIPTLTCTTEGKLLVSENDINKPIALITADELAFGGSVYNTDNYHYYLYKGYLSWTMTPYGNLGVFRLGSRGQMSVNATTTQGRLAPVINLTKEYARTLKWNDTYKAYYAG